MACQEIDYYCTARVNGEPHRHGLPVPLQSARSQSAVSVVGFASPRVARSSKQTTARPNFSCFLTLTSCRACASAFDVANVLLIYCTPRSNSEKERKARTPGPINRTDGRTAASLCCSCLLLSDCRTVGPAVPPRAATTWSMSIRARCSRRGRRRRGPCPSSASSSRTPPERAPRSPPS